MDMKIYVKIVINKQYIYKMDNKKFYDYILEKYNITKEEYNHIKSCDILKYDKDLFELIRIYFLLKNKDHVPIEKLKDDIIKKHL